MPYVPKPCVPNPFAISTNIKCSFENHFCNFDIFILRLGPIYLENSFLVMSTVVKLRQKMCFWQFSPCNSILLQGCTHVYSTFWNWNWGIFCNLEKYISQFGQNNFISWTNTNISICNFVPTNLKIANKQISSAERPHSCVLKKLKFVQI